MTLPGFNFKSSDLVPTAFVWQLWKIIISGTVAGLAGFGVVIFIGIVWGILSQTTFFNEDIRKQMEYFDRCKATWDLAHTATVDQNRGINICYSRARLNTLSRNSF
jgi:hypothetical protein